MPSSAEPKQKTGGNQPLECSRILVIRGGAIGDFILTLPAIRLLREAAPAAGLEILGYRHIAVLAEKRFYATATRSIEAGPLARFFGPDLALPNEWVDYFARFDLIVSYLFDPDKVFENNLRRCGCQNFVIGPAKAHDREHLAGQLARPLERLGLVLHDHAAKLFPSDDDRKIAAGLIGQDERPPIVLHPGSGSEQKNWPLERWRELGRRLLAEGREFLVVGGEADEERLRVLESVWRNEKVRFVKGPPLPHLAALCEGAFFLGHDSGISHLAAAAGAKCVLLFGPTDPAIWAPANRDVTVLRASTGRLEDIGIDAVIAAVDGTRYRIFRSSL